MVKIVRFLHLHNICHRDLKAENFLFAKKDHQKLVLIDFGLSFEWKEDMEG
jgi:calcium-dependent protein kinase